MWASLDFIPLHLRHGCSVSRHRGEGLKKAEKILQISLSQEGRITDMHKSQNAFE